MWVLHQATHIYIIFINLTKCELGGNAFGCVCPCVYLSAANLTYLWTHQPNIVCAHLCILEDVLWLQLITIFWKACCNDFSVSAPLTADSCQPVRAPRDQQLLDNILYVEATLVLVDSFVAIFTLNSHFTLLVVWTLHIVSPSIHYSHAFTLDTQPALHPCSPPTCPQTPLVAICTLLSGLFSFTTCVAGVNLSYSLCCCRCCYTAWYCKI